MNFTFSWIMDKFGFQPKVEIEPFPVKKPVAKKTEKKPAAKKVAKKTVAKKTAVKKRA
jgi:hypothetical protein